MLNYRGIPRENSHFEFPYNLVRRRRCESTIPSVPCRKWTCEKDGCREARYKREAKRLDLGFEYIERIGQRLWFVTVTLSDKSQSTYSESEIIDFKERVRKYFARLKFLAQKRNIPLHYWFVYDIKGAHSSIPFQLHIHAIVSWSPDECNGNVSSDPQIMIEEAGKLDLSVHISLVRNKTKTRNYLIQKLRDISLIRFPKNFWRLVISRNWPQLHVYRKKKVHHKKKSLRQLQQILTTCGMTWHDGTALAFVYQILRPSIRNPNLSFYLFFIVNSRKVRFADRVVKFWIMSAQYRCLIRKLLNTMLATLLRIYSNVFNILSIIDLIYLIIQKMAKYQYFNDLQIKQKTNPKPQNNYPNRIILQDIAFVVILWIFIIFSWLAMI